MVAKQGHTINAKLNHLTEAAAKLAEIANIKLENNKPYIGNSAFAHKAGMHADGVLKNPQSFEHIAPDLVGNKRRLLLSDMAGRSAMLEKVAGFTSIVDKNDPTLVKIIEKVKELEHFGYQFEAADASFELLVKKINKTYKKHFSLVFYKIMGEYPTPKGEKSATATIKVSVGDMTEMTAAAGQGPVNALDIALRKSLKVFYPSLDSMHLTDYKVRVLERGGATAAKVRVLIESSDGETSWTTVGVSHDIIDASLIALVDSIEYKLAKDLD